MTGFGLAGHLHEILEASGTAAMVHWDALPLFEGVYEYSHDGCRPGKVFDVIDWARDFIPQGIMDDTTYDDRMGVLCDPQTSGGLLVSLPRAQADAYLEAFERLAGHKAAVIAEVVDGPRGYVFIR